MKLADLSSVYMSILYFFLSLCNGESSTLTQTAALNSNNSISVKSRHRGQRRIHYDRRDRDGYYDRENSQRRDGYRDSYYDRDSYYRRDGYRDGYRDDYKGGGSGSVVYVPVPTNSGGATIGNCICPPASKCSSTNINLIFIFIMVNTVINIANVINNNNNNQNNINNNNNNMNIGGRRNSNQFSNSSHPSEAFRTQLPSCLQSFICEASLEAKQSNASLQFLKVQRKLLKALRYPINPSSSLRDFVSITTELCFLPKESCSKLNTLKMITELLQSN